jgi:hypothetical protein
VLATGSTDRSVRISLCDPGDLVAELAGRTTRRLSAEEWRHLVGNEAHTPDREPPPFPPIDTAQQLVESPATPAPSGPQAEAPAGS